MRVRARAGLGVPLAVALMACGRPTEAPAPVDATAVLECVRDAYASCDSYKDTAIVRSRFVAADGKSSEYADRKISTAWLRPGRFRLECDDDMPYGAPPLRTIVWSDGDQVESWWDGGDGIESGGSLSDALRRGPTVQSLASTWVPALLPLGVDIARIVDARDAAAILEEHDGEPCYRIEASFPASPEFPPHKETFWVGQTNWLVRHIACDCSTADGNHVLIDVDYSAAMNVFVSDKELAAGFPK